MDQPERACSEVMTPAEHALFWRRVSEARRQGRDIFEYMDRHGNLVTAGQGAKIRSDALHQAADRLEKATVKDILARYGSHSNNALDAQAGIVALLRDWAEQERRQG